MSVPGPDRQAIRDAALSAALNVIGDIPSSDLGHTLVNRFTVYGMVLQAVKQDGAGKECRQALSSFEDSLREFAPKLSNSGQGTFDGSRQSEQLAKQLQRTDKAMLSLARLMGLGVLMKSVFERQVLPSVVDRIGRNFPELFHQGQWNASGALDPTVFLQKNIMDETNAAIDSQLRLGHAEGLCGVLEQLVKVPEFVIGPRTDQVPNMSGFPAQPRYQSPPGIGSFADGGHGRVWVQANPVIKVAVPGPDATHGLAERALGLLDKLVDKYAALALNMGTQMRNVSNQPAADSSRAPVDWVARFVSDIDPGAIDTIAEASPYAAEESRASVFGPARDESDHAAQVASIKESRPPFRLVNDNDLVVPHGIDGWQFHSPMDAQGGARNQGADDRGYFSDGEVARPFDSDRSHISHAVNGGFNASLRGSNATWPARVDSQGDSEQLAGSEFQNHSPVSMQKNDVGDAVMRDRAGADSTAQVRTPGRNANEGREGGDDEPLALRLQRARAELSERGLAELLARDRKDSSQAPVHEVARFVSDIDPDEIDTIAREPPYAAEESRASVYGLAQDVSDHAAQEASIKASRSPFLAVNDNHLVVPHGIDGRQFHAPMDAQVGARKQGADDRGYFSDGEVARPFDSDRSSHAVNGGFSASLRGGNDTRSPTVDSQGDLEQLAGSEVQNHNPVSMQENGVGLAATRGRPRSDSSAQFRTRNQNAIDGRQGGDDEPLALRLQRARAELRGGELAKLLVRDEKRSQSGYSGPEVTKGVVGRLALPANHHRP
ncbi:hypothetical protein [Dyella sp. Tek66A03]|uniref:hypothetical protein n=1 Tax=Dyella sp. Tek66A03 TaxID=3458298 RepID=UPI00403E550B